MFTGQRGSLVRPTVDQLIKQDPGNSCKVQSYLHSMIAGNKLDKNQNAFF